MNINLSSKERTLLEDQKSHEEICIKKYTDYANQTSCPQLKSILLQNAQQEREHYNTINQLLNGQMPAGNQQGNQSGTQQGGSSGQQGGASAQHGSKQQAQEMQSQNNMAMNNSSSNTDKDLCTDLLMTEKYVSGTYDTAIFEFRDPQIRNLLNHIQKEEQQHGESIFQYMQSKGLYQVK